MVGGAKSRWAEDEEDAATALQRKREKEEKKRAKAEKQRKLDEAAAVQRQEHAVAHAASQPFGAQNNDGELSSRPQKRRKLSPEPADERPPARLLRFTAPDWKRCRSVEDYEKLNDIEEGAYGWVSRAKDTATGEVVALKRLKMENAQEGIPVTGLREIQTLFACDHPNIVRLQQVVVGEDTSNIEK